MELERRKFLGAHWEQVFDLVDVTRSGTLTFEEFWAFVLAVTEDELQTHGLYWTHEWKLRFVEADSDLTAAELETVEVRSWETFLHRAGWYRYLAEHPEIKAQAERLRQGDTEVTILQMMADGVAQVAERDPRWVERVVEEKYDHLGDGSKPIRRGDIM